MKETVFSSLDKFKPLSKICRNCRTLRNEVCYKDRNENEKFSNIIPGFYSKFPKNISSSSCVDLIIIAESHGGGEEWYDPQKDTKSEIRKIENYYLKDKIETFHQDQVRILLKYLNENKISWYFTDLVKCYVSKKSEVNHGEVKNFKTAIENCRLHLDSQLAAVKSRMIIGLGGYVVNTMTKKELIHGEEYSYNGTKFIASYFPSRNTADLWSKKNGWKRIIEVVISELKK